MHLKERWNKFWEKEAREFDKAIGEIVIKETREQNKEFFDFFDN